MRTAAELIETEKSRDNARRFPDPKHKPVAVERLKAYICEVRTSF
jgi:hypothetical protein